MLTNVPSSVYLLSRKFAIVDITQIYRTPLPVIPIVLFFHILIIIIIIIIIIILLLIVY
jgi:hypothetical protein